ncbi:hypothetical protein TIFTF001_026382 [Ficus carica]|uniref:Uncharacterized protein n=1 Tax=Ficus carica TaxID=3494 RepID=A0AA88DL56_FICCA|nr:hypothetical protein TIFTF001_026382 [Ficus carica]
MLTEKTKDFSYEHRWRRCQRQVLDAMVARENNSSDLDEVMIADNDKVLYR